MGAGRDGDELSQGGFPVSAIPSTLKSRMKLVTTDEKQTVIAEFHPAHSFTKKRKARLEIRAAGMNMLDYIILTFVFADSTRREREGSTKSSGGGTGLLFFLLYHNLIRRENTN